MENCASQCCEYTACAGNITATFKKHELFESAPAYESRERRMEKLQILSVPKFSWHFLECVWVCRRCSPFTITIAGTAAWFQCVRAKSMCQPTHPRGRTTTSTWRPPILAHESSSRAMTAVGPLVVLWLSRRQHVAQFLSLLPLLFIFT